jgi:hypothetical protein
MTTDRRGFLGGAGAVGLAMSSIFEKATVVVAKDTGGTTQAITPGYTIVLGDITAEFRGNELSPSRINGVNSLIHLSNPTVNAFDGPGGYGCGGINYEHIMAGHDDPRNQFTPRSGPFILSVIGPTTVQLVRRWQDEPWLVGAVVTFHMVAPHYIDVDVRLTPHDAGQFGATQYALFMFADYMSPVIDTALHFRGLTALGAPETWIAADATLNPKTGLYDAYNTGGNWIHETAFPLTVEPNHSTAICINSYTWPRYTVPTYYGLSRHGLVYQVMFDQTWSPEGEIRFTQFHYKLKKDPANPKPALDFQYVIHQPVSDRTYGFKMRALWKPFVSAVDCLNEYADWRATL